MRLDLLHHGEGVQSHLLNSSKTKKFLEAPSTDPSSNFILLKPQKYYFSKRESHYEKYILKEGVTTKRGLHTPIDNFRQDVTLVRGPAPHGGQRHTMCNPIHQRLGAQLWHSCQT